MKVEASVKHGKVNVREEFDAALESEARVELEAFVEATRREAENYFSGISDLIVGAHLQAANYLRASVNDVEAQFHLIKGDVQAIVDASNLLTLNIHAWAEAVLDGAFEDRLAEFSLSAHAEAGAQANAFLQEADAESKVETSLELRIALTEEIESRFNKARVEAKESFTLAREAILGCSAYAELKETFKAEASAAADDVRAEAKALIDLTKAIKAKVEKSAEAFEAHMNQEI